MVGGAALIFSFLIGSNPQGTADKCIQSLVQLTIHGKSQGQFNYNRDLQIHKQQVDAFLKAMSEGRTNDPLVKQFTNRTKQMVQNIQLQLQQQGIECKSNELNVEVLTTGDHPLNRAAIIAKKWGSSLGFSPIESIKGLGVFDGDRKLISLPFQSSLPRQIEVFRHELVHAVLDSLIDRDDADVASLEVRTNHWDGAPEAYKTTFSFSEPLAYQVSLLTEASYLKPDQSFKETVEALHQMKSIVNNYLHASNSRADAIKIATEALPLSYEVSVNILSPTQIQVTSKGRVYRLSKQLNSKGPYVQLSVPLDPNGGTMTIPLFHSEALKAFNGLRDDQHPVGPFLEITHRALMVLEKPEDEQKLVTNKVLSVFISLMKLNPSKLQPGDLQQPKTLEVMSELKSSLKDLQTYGFPELPEQAVKDIFADLQTGSSPQIPK